MSKQKTIYEKKYDTLLRIYSSSFIASFIAFFSIVSNLNIGVANNAFLIGGTILIMGIVHYFYLIILNNYISSNAIIDLAYYSGVLMIGHFSLMYFNLSKTPYYLVGIISLIIGISLGGYVFFLYKVQGK